MDITDCWAVYLLFFNCVRMIGSSSWGTYEAANWDRALGIYIMWFDRKYIPPWGSLVSETPRRGLVVCVSTGITLAGICCIHFIFHPHLCDLYLFIFIYLYILCEHLPYIILSFCIFADTSPLYSGSHGPHLLCMYCNFNYLYVSIIVNKDIIYLFFIEVGTLFMYRCFLNCWMCNIELK